MIKELEKMIEELKQKRANLKQLKNSNNNNQFLQGVYCGQRIELLEQIKYLKGIVKQLKG